MCGFAGFSNFDYEISKKSSTHYDIGMRMGMRLSHRGPDDSGVYVSKNCVLSHTRLAVMDPLLGRQPMTAFIDGISYTIAYNGEIYNTKELKQVLKLKGHVFDTNCDTEVVLKAYIEFGDKVADYLNGIFAFAIDDTKNKRLFLCRDRFGVKPLFYTISDNTLVFASEIKALFEYPKIKPVIDKNGLCEIFGVGPARSPGSGVFKNIFELEPGFNAIFNENGLTKTKYYTIECYEHEDSYEKTVDYVRELLFDIADRQLVSDVPICTFLSGGLDSSVITALAARKFSQTKMDLSTYSFDFEENSTYFSPTAFQPTADEPWAQKVSALLGTTHKTLVCSNEDLFSNLFDAVIAKDLPGMADIDSSLLYFCNKVKQNHKVVLCGECADEIFGGYPWFKEMDYKTFPWSRNIDFRSSVLNADILKEINLFDYTNNLLEKTINDTPLYYKDNEDMKKMRKMSYLNITWFMQTLLNRKDRCSMYSGLEVRVPYADHRLLEYVYNLPWSYKCKNGVQKSVLRDAARGVLPDSIIDRKKSPFPKTHNPVYETMLKNKLKCILKDPLQPILKILSKDTVSALLKEEFDYGKPWFGQLMAGPQLLAYLLQINYWLIRYNIYLDI